MKLEITVPATTANLGPGFDVLGAALTLRNRFALEVGGSGIRILGDASPELRDPQDNLFMKAFQAAHRIKGHFPPPVSLEMEVKIPLKSGLGSSASAIIGGIGAANALLPSPLSQQEVLDLASSLDGHPDNVAAAYLGGVTIASQDSGLTVRRLDPPQLRAIIFHPGTTISTESSRASVPQRVSREDAVFNLGRVALLVFALAKGDDHLLGQAMEDRLHQSERLQALPGAEALFARAKEAGALACALSGSGPSLLFLSRQRDEERIVLAVETEGLSHYPKGRVFRLGFSGQGLSVELQP